MKRIATKDGSLVLLNLIKTIQDNKDYLSEIDGLIGDGDHGVNMSKGFGMCKVKLENKQYSLSEGLIILGDTLMDDIGGSMGPLYGVFFQEMGLACKEEFLDKNDVRIMLENGLKAIMEIGNAKQGDKSLLDTLIPGLSAYAHAIEIQAFPEALEILRSGAHEGWLSTKDMVAKIGRASRLGERSRGVLDAGATSCYLILDALCTSFQDMLKQ
jgi:dihydroxyacetone kinase-like protein